MPERPRVLIPSSRDLAAEPYEITITKAGRFGYHIAIIHGITAIGPYPSTLWSAWTRDGAERKARRIVERCKRDDKRRLAAVQSVIEGLPAEDKT